MSGARNAVMAERKTIPKPVREQVLKEFNHRCAICAADRPHLHHIDEDPSNNEALNIIPLCPNCHLIDQHNPTAPMDQRKLRMFRIHKDPLILSPQFQPLFSRFLFLDSIGDDQEGSELAARVRELISFVSALEMGQFYSKQLESLLKPKSQVYVFGLSGEPIEDPSYLREHPQEYREQVRRARDSVHSLVIELLRYQKWK
jgi:hypothetical protein